MSGNTMTPQELAKRWEVTISTLERWRIDGIGPRYLKLNRNGTVRYRRDDIDAYERSTERQGTQLPTGGTP